MIRLSTSVVLEFLRAVSLCVPCACVFLFFFFNDTATTEIYTLSLHDALPICTCCPPLLPRRRRRLRHRHRPSRARRRSIRDRKSTRLNSSHLVISYAVFCLKKKKTHHSRLLSIASYLPHHPLQRCDRLGIIAY